MEEQCFLLDSIELKEKNINVPNPQLPEANNKWREEEIIFLKDALEEVSDDGIDDTILWLAEGLGRTPFSVACMISSYRDLPKRWRDKYRKVLNDIRRSNLTISEYAKQTAQSKW